MKSSYLILFFFLTLLACNKDPRSGQVEIYLLKSYQLVTGKCQVDAATAVLQDQPLVTNSGILWYNKSDYEYALNDVSYQKIKSLTARTPFAVTVDKKVIFYAIYMPSFMSSTCDKSITMDILYPDTKINLRLGYPWAMGQIDDERNNPLLLASFKSQGKLR